MHRWTRRWLRSAQRRSRGCRYATGRAPLRLRPAEYGPYPRLELVDRKRFHQVIVSPGVEGAYHLSVLAASGGDDDDFSAKGVFEESETQIEAPGEIKAGETAPTAADGEKADDAKCTEDHEHGPDCAHGHDDGASRRVPPYPP